MTRRTLTTIVLTFSLILTTATAAWSFTFPQKVFQAPTLLKTMEPPPPPPPPFGVGSVATYTGHLDSVTVATSDNPTCRAHVVTDDQKTFEASADMLYGVRPQEMQAFTEPFFQESVCQGLQAAFLKGWNVSMLVMVSEMANATDPSKVSIQRLETGPESIPASETLENLVSCPDPYCSQTGNVVAMVTDLRNEAELCGARLSVPSAYGPPLRAWLDVAFTVSKQVVTSTSITTTPDRLIPLHTQRSLCAGLMDAMATGQPVTVGGKTVTLNWAKITVDKLERKLNPPEGTL